MGIIVADHLVKQGWESINSFKDQVCDIVGSLRSYIHRRLCIKLNIISAWCTATTNSRALIAHWILKRLIFPRGWWTIMRRHLQCCHPLQGGLGRCRKRAPGTCSCLERQRTDHPLLRPIRVWYLLVLFVMPSVAALGTNDGTMLLLLMRTAPLGMDIPRTSTVPSPRNSLGGLCEWSQLRLKPRW